MGIPSHFLLFLQFFSEVKPFDVPITPLSVQFVPVVSPLFTQFVSLFFKTLSEYKKRFAVYQDNLVRARKMQDMEQGSAKYGETVFSDLTGLSSQL